VYVYVWCKECQHTITADPEKTRSCPNCGSAHLNALVPKGKRTAPPVVTVECEGKDWDGKPCGVIHNVALGDMRADCSRCGAPLSSARRLPRNAEEVLLPKDLLGSDFIAVVYDGKVVNVLTNNASRQSMLSYLCASNLKLVQDCVDSMWGVERPAPKPKPQPKPQAKPTPLESQPIELIIPAGVLGTQVKALVRDAKLVDIQMVTDMGQPWFVPVSPECWAKVSAYIGDVLESRAIFDKLEKEGRNRRKRD